jgi:hypothetical protein
MVKVLYEFCQIASLKREQIFFDRVCKANNLVEVVFIGDQGVMRKPPFNPQVVQKKRFYITRHEPAPV